MVAPGYVSSGYWINHHLSSVISFAWMNERMVETVVHNAEKCNKKYLVAVDYEKIYRVFRYD